jgi:hypothetical protein
LQTWHVPFTCPTADWKRPAAHPAQEFFMPAGETEPAAHSVHVPFFPMSANLPAGHANVSESSQIVPPLLPWNFPSGQLSHDVLRKFLWYFPGRQAVHSPEVAPLHLPLGQGSQEVAPLVLYVPALQGEHSVAPLASWYSPSEQLLHETEAPWVLNLPVGQASQDVCSSTGWNRPAAHPAHATLSWLDPSALVRALPAAHAIQDALPVEGWYRFTAHGVTLLLPSHVLPTGQAEHEVRVRESPPAVNLPAGHATQLLAPVTALNMVSAPHLSQEVRAPAAAACLPAGQGAQAWQRQDKALWLHDSIPVVVR